MSRRTLGTINLATVLVATAVWSVPADACSWPRDLYKETVRSSTKMKGSLRILSVNEKTMPGPDGTAGVWSHTFRAVVTDRRGQTAQVEFEIPAIDALRTCTPFKLPEGDVSGTFYLRTLESGRYELVHWKANT